MVIVKARQDTSPDLRAVQRGFPTPVAIETTPVPTVTVRPVLDQPAPDEVLMTLDGEAFSLADFEGKIAIVSFWATWCPPCLEEMPLLQEYAVSHPDIPVIAITDSDDGQTLEDIQKFIAKHQLTDLIFGLDASRLLFNAFNIVNLPMTFVLDPTGIVRFRQIGAVKEEDLNFYVSELER